MIFCRFSECLICTPYGFIEDSLPTQEKLGEIMVQSLIYFCLPMLFRRLIQPKVLETAPNIAETIPKRDHSVVPAVAVRVILDYLRAGVSYEQ